MDAPGIGRPIDVVDQRVESVERDSLGHLSPRGHDDELIPNSEKAPDIAVIESDKSSATVALAAEAFGVEPGDGLWLDPTDRVRIW